MNMTEEQFEQYLKVLKDKNEVLQNIAWSIGDLGTAIQGMYDGSTTSAFYGMSQAMFAIEEKLKDQND